MAEMTPAPEPRPPAPPPAAGETAFDLSGGRLCLDFANTVGGRAAERTVERLNTYPDLVNWSRQAGVLDGREAASLVRRAARRPKEAARVMERARDLREAVFRIFAATAAGEAPPRDALDHLNRRLERSCGRLRLEPRSEGFALGWAEESDALDRMLGAVAWSAAQLLTSADLAAVKECAHPTCRWLFLDCSRNRSRRWCDMAACGNRAKAQRHYRRLKGGAGRAARQGRRRRGGG